MTRTDTDCLPTFLILGAAKAGTSSLYHYLDQHPEISMSSLKETNFFLTDKFMEGLSDYRQYFDPGKVARGEASPMYSCFPYLQSIPERIHSLLPDVKLIYLVRDPLERAESMYWERYVSNHAPRSIHEAFADADNPRNLFVCSSKYATQVEQYLKYFPASRLLIIDSRDLRHNRRETLRETFSYLGVDPGFVSPQFEVELNTKRKRRTTHVQTMLKHSPMARAARYTIPVDVRRCLFAPARRMVSASVTREPLSEEARQRLAEAIRSDIERFRELTKREFAHWSV